MKQNGHNGSGVAGLSDDLIAKARAIASRSDELLELLEDARQRLLDSDQERDASKEPEPAPKRRFKPQAESKPKPTPKPRARARAGSELSEGLRLLTTQMSAAGADRREIAEHLRRDFGIEDPDRILKSMGL